MFNIFLLNKLITFSKKLGVDKATLEKFHFFKLINDGSKVQDNIQAHNMPNPIDIPYPVIAVIGDDVMVENAAEVVIDVRKIGIERRLRVKVIALLTSLLFFASLKNLEIICTPSEFAIVNNIIGMELFRNVKINFSDFVT